MRQLKYIVLFVVLAAFALANLFLFESHKLIQSYVYLLAPLAATVCALQVGYRYGWKTRHGFSFCFISAGFASWLIAEVIFIYFDVHLDTAPFPSIADLFFILAAPLLTIGIVLEMLIAKARPSLYQLVGGLVALILVTAYLFGLVYDPDVVFIEKVASLGYLLVDSLLLIVAFYALKITFEYGGKIRLPWALISLAAGLYLIGDFLYLYFLDQYESRLLWALQVDTIWFASYIVFAIAMARIKDILADAESKLRQNI